jgi:uncharacterized membrane protein YedE/YeeE
MKQAVVSFLVGVIFALGLGLSGMLQPAKILGFLDLVHWNPSLLFVMVGAIGVHAIGYRLVRRRSSPLLDSQWHVPTRKDITASLIIGSALFGVGWGLVGYCPGPALVSLATLQREPLLFVSAMIVGMLAFRFFEKKRPQ